MEVGKEFDVPMRLANLTLAELTEALNKGWINEIPVPPCCCRRNAQGLKCGCRGTRLEKVLQVERE